MIFITDFADQAVLLPVAVTVGVGLLLMGWRRGAWAWAGAVCATLAVMVVLKLASFDCGWMYPRSGLLSPSGHTATAALVIGGLCGFLAPTGGAGVAILAATGVAAAIGATRLALGVHTLPDVIVGALVGVLAAFAMRSLAGPQPPNLAWPRLLLAVVTVAFLFHGTRLQAETQLHWAALEIWPLTLCLPAAQ